MKRLCLVWLLTYGCSETVIASEVLIDSVAGTGRAENNGDSGPAAAINIGDPFGVEIGPDDALYITEVRNHRVRRFDFATAELTTVAGCGRRGYSGDAGPAVMAELNEPYEVRFDDDGNMYIVEMMNHVVRRVDGKTKIISTVAGTGDQGFSGDGGLAVKAQFNRPHSIALDDNGALYVADIGNHRIRRIDLMTGLIDSIAGNSQRRLPQDGQVAFGNPLFGPRALFVDGNTLWVALREGYSIWRLNLTDGILHHVAGTGQAGFDGDGRPAAEAKFNGPKGIAVSNGNVFVVDSENNAVRRIDLESGLIATVVGRESRERGGADQRRVATDAELNQPHGLCVTPDGTIFVGDTLNHRIRRIKSPESNLDSKEPVLRHAVFFKFKASSTKEAVNGIVRAFRALPSRIKEIQELQSGENISDAGFADGLTHCFLLTFKDEAGRAAYLPHPDHKAFGALLRPHLDKVFVIDYWGQPQPMALKKELKHAVFVKFKDGTSDGDVRKIELGLADLPSKIEAIKALEWGRNNSPETHDDGFTHCFMFTFDSEKGLNEYVDHPAHSAVASQLKSIVENIRVLDFWADGVELSENR